MLLNAKETTEKSFKKTKELLSSILKRRDSGSFIKSNEYSEVFSVLNTFYESVFLGTQYLIKSNTIVNLAINDTSITRDICKLTTPDELFEYLKDLAKKN